MPEDRSILSRPGPAPDAQQSYGPHPDQVIDWYLPARQSAGPVVVFIHGGYWRPEYDREHARSAAGGLAAAGFTTALIEYRRIPGQPRTMLDDVTAAIDAAAMGPEGAPGTQVVLIGHSAGGHLALVAAAGANPAIAGVLALAPLADLRLAEQLDLDDGAVRDFLGGAAENHDVLDPAQLPIPSCSAVILHGEDDTVVPFAISSLYAQQGNARLLGLPGVGHFELIDPSSQAWTVVISELTSIVSVGSIE